MNAFAAPLKGKKAATLLLSLLAIPALGLSQETKPRETLAENDRPILIQMLHFRSTLMDSMKASGGTETSRRLLETYHEEVAVPAFRSTCELANRQDDESLLREVYQFVSACGDSTDEEVGMIGASVFKHKWKQSSRVIRGFDTEKSMTILNTIEFGIKNSEMKPDEEKELLQVVAALRKELRPL